MAASAAKAKAAALVAKATINGLTLRKMLIASLGAKDQGSLVTIASVEGGKGISVSSSNGIVAVEATAACTVDGAINARVPGQVLAALAKTLKDDDVTLTPSETGVRVEWSTGKYDLQVDPTPMPPINYGTGTATLTLKGSVLDQIANGCGWAASASTINNPSLLGIQIAYGAQGLRVTATDATVVSLMDIPDVTGGDGEGVAVISAQDLLTFGETFGAATDVTVTLTDKGVVLQGVEDSISFTMLLRTYETEKYPAVRNMIPETLEASAEVSPDEFYPVIERSMLAAESVGTNIRITAQGENVFVTLQKGDSYAEHVPATVTGEFSRPLDPKRFRMALRAHTAEGDSLLLEASDGGFQALGVSYTDAQTHKSYVMPMVDESPVAPPVEADNTGTDQTGTEEAAAESESSTAVAPEAPVQAPAEVTQTEGSAGEGAQASEPAAQIATPTQLRVLEWFSDPDMEVEAAFETSDIEACVEAGWLEEFPPEQDGDEATFGITEAGQTVLADALAAQATQA